jgi:hypothetical protein
MVYEGTLQAEALALVATKLRSSLMVEGELPLRAWRPSTATAKRCSWPWRAD